MPQKTLQMFEQKSRSRKHKAGNIPPNSKSDVLVKYKTRWDTNCGKTFLLKPLEIIFRTFTNPANAKYAWVGADQAEVIALQDFHWSSELICWKNLLILLEGEM